MAVSNIQPFNLYRNIFFVGSTKVSVHIIKTQVGLVMIDTGFPDMYDQILDSMQVLSLNPRDICAIFHSHGHIDHYGCTERFKALSGAKTYISRIDNNIVNGTLDLSWTTELGLEYIDNFNCDVLIEDEDVFEFGSTKIRCVHTPGHTDGVMSFFITDDEDSEHVISAMHGGIGLNSLRKDFLEKYNLSSDCREKFRNSLVKLSGEHVDLVLGNHPGQSDTEGKLKKVLRGESPVDRGEWQSFLDGVMKKLESFLEKEAASYTKYGGGCNERQNNKNNR